MLNYLWSFMIIFSIFLAFLAGNLQCVTQSVFDCSQDAVVLCFKTCGSLAMWMGIMRIAEKAGIIDALATKMEPLLDFLFPDLPPKHLARKYIATNMIANFLGLGWAATPPGLKAMVELQKLNTSSHTATCAMCTFLIINISSIQLIPINIITYRASYGSQNPTEIVSACILATLLSTGVAVIFSRCMYRRNK